MLKLAVKMTFEERVNDLANSAEWHEQLEKDRYAFCLSQAWSTGDRDRYNRLIATGVADC